MKDEVEYGSGFHYLPSMRYERSINSLCGTDRRMKACASGNRVTGSSRRPGTPSSSALPVSNRLVVDLGALRDNFRALAARGTGAECAAVVKADAYGLGLEPVARTLVRAGARTFFTAFTAEALNLRALLPDAGIFVLSPSLESDAAALLREKLVPCLYDRAGVEAWSALGAAQGVPVPAAIHVETGINRLGMSEGEARALGGEWKAVGDRWLDLRLVMSHLANGDDPKARSNRVQLERFRGLRSLFPHVPASFANSAGVLLGPEYHFDLMRPGISLFGHDPHYRDTAPRVRPVATFEARLAQVKHLRAGETVGYGATFTCPHAMRIGVVLAGYADGLPRRMSSSEGKSPLRLSIGAHRVPVLGRVSMDMTVVDLGAVAPEDAPPGTMVEVFGPSVSIESVAERAGTIPNEILTGIGRRVPRVYVNEDGPSSGAG